MKINNNILIGVEYPRLVNFYGTILHYTLELTLQYPDVSDHDLIGLVVYSPDNGNSVIETFYTLKDEIVYEIICTGNKDTKAVWSNIEISDRVKMFENIRKQNHILDLEYFLKNN